MFVAYFNFIETTNVIEKIAILASVFVKTMSFCIYEHESIDQRLFMNVQTPPILSWRGDITPFNSNVYQ